MYRLLFLVFAVLLAMMVFAVREAPPSQASEQKREPPPFVADQVIVGFQPGTPAATISEAHRQAGGRVLHTLDAIGVQLVAVPAQSVLDKVGIYRHNPNVRYAEPNYLRPLILPDEGSEPWPYQPGATLEQFNEQWGLNNAGQSFSYDSLTLTLGEIAGTADSDIDAPEGWDISTGSADVVIAVLDSGVECDHPDLAGKCVEELNFGPSTYGTRDVLGHGTHVAGIAAANTDNGHGVAGVGWNSRIASLKVCYEYFDPLYLSYIGLCDAFASASAMIHAADSGYRVINMSYAGPEGSQAEQDAAAYAWSRNVVLVAAAANNYTPEPMYPAAFPEVIATAATDWHDNLASFSSFGKDWVSVAAPGHTIFSTVSTDACGQPDCYGWFSGTSMASPHVAGAAAVVWAHLGPSASSADVRAAIEGGADRQGALGQNFLAWTRHGRLNLHGALTYSAEPPPPGGGTVHVGDLDGASLPVSKGRWEATVSVMLHNSDEAPVANALVSGTWSDGANGSCTTGVDGQCSIAKGGLKQNVVSVTFSVAEVSHTTMSYAAADNHDPDGDSSGTVITIGR